MRSFTPCRAMLALLVALAPTAAAQPPRLLVNLPAFPRPVLLDSLGTPVELDASRSRVFAAVLAVYADLKIPVEVRDSIGGVVGNARLVQTGRLGKEQLSRYLGCGSGMTGPNADTFRVQLAVVTMIQSTSPTRTRLRTAVAAAARNIEGNSSDAVQCETTGELEVRIATLVSNKLSTP